VEYVDYERHKSEPVDGFILQGPVSDREAMVLDSRSAGGPGQLEETIAQARSMVQDGRPEDLMPLKTLPSMLSGTPVSARRFLALATKEYASPTNPSTKHATAPFYNHPLQVD
jgi:hypothetical protein